MTRSIDCKLRYQGALVGLAVGDALGTTLEFKPPGTFEPTTDMVGGGPFDLKAGEFTDDTSMALCLAESLLEKMCFDPVDQMQRYCRWYREGYLSSNGTCFDIGLTVRSALHDFEATGEPYSGSIDEYSAGNGSLMRLAPIPMTYRTNMKSVWKAAADSSRTTHGAKACLDACGVYSIMIARALEGEEKNRVLDSSVRSLPFKLDDLGDSIREVVSGSYRTKNSPEIRGTGYVVEALEAALWAFWHSKTFKEGALLAVNLGDDADTTGAIYGQLAGAYYGLEGIPEKWREKLVMRELIEEYSVKLLRLSMRVGGNASDPYSTHAEEQT